MQLLTLSAGLSQEHEMHDPDEGILAAFDSIAEASCVCAFFFFLIAVFFVHLLFVFFHFSQHNIPGETLQVSMTQGDEELAAWRAKVTVAYIMVKRCLPKKTTGKHVRNYVITLKTTWVKKLESQSSREQSDFAYHWTTIAL